MFREISIKKCLIEKTPVEDSKQKPDIWQSIVKMDAIFEEFLNVPVYSKKKKIIEILKVSIEEFYSE